MSDTMFSAVDTQVTDATVTDVVHEEYIGYEDGAPVEVEDYSYPYK